MEDSQTGAEANAKRTMSDKVKVFVSWSGNLSKAVAEAMEQWIGDVIQMSSVFLSSAGIEPGEGWGSRLNEELDSTNLGIIVLTRENKDKPWILFEAGALSKGLKQARVCPVYVDLAATDVKQPLSQFQGVAPDLAGMWKLAKLINDNSGQAKMEEPRLKRAFEPHFDNFAKRMAEALANNKPKDLPPKRSEYDMLAELVENTRAILRAQQAEIATTVHNPYYPLPAELSSQLTRARARGLIDWLYDAKAQGSPEKVNAEMLERYLGKTEPQAKPEQP
jgi:hypothetical protein